MTSNQIAWWNIQESIRSHQQNELNERNKNSITQSLGDEQNRINASRMKNDFVLGKQGNAINQQQANTAATRAAQDYEVGMKGVKNQEIRNQNDYEIGTTSNEIRAKEVANNYIIGSGTVKNQTIRNAQDYALGQMQQKSYGRMADAAVLTAGTKLAELNPAQIVVAVTSPTLQKEGAAAAAATSKKVKEVAKTVATTPITEIIRPVRPPVKGTIVTPEFFKPGGSRDTKPVTPSKQKSPEKPTLKGRYRK